LSDIGRPISHFSITLNDPNLLRDAQAVLDRLAPAEAEVLGNDQRWYLRRIVPYRTQDNRIDGVVATFADITGPKEAEQALRAARDQIEQIYDSVPHPLVVLDPELRVRSANEMFYRAFQVQRGETEGRAIHDLGNRQWDVPRLRELLAAVAAQRETLEDFVVEHEFEHLGERIMRLQARRVSGADLILLSIEDITEQRHWEDHQKLLISELSHRVKNTLATVQSIAAQTIRHSTSLESFYQDFSGRLQALGGAHALLTEHNWRSLGIRAVVLEPLRAYTMDADRVRLEGPDIDLKPGAALALSLVVHELATNAAKHGALSNQAGGVAISWKLTSAESPRRLHFVWRESGGPTVAGATARGFGLSLIERIVSYELDGEARHDFAPEGFACELLLPYRADNFQAHGSLAPAG
jgi:two-component system, chemotaxis family, CheB/CheR fusion protein